MPRAGGEAGKLGNRYEGIWIGDNLLDLITGIALAITVEPFGDEALGIEFSKTLPDSIVEYHSVKRQTTGTTWTLCDLTAADKKTGRSILGDLLERQKADGRNKAVFISATTANELNELCERASRSRDPAAFAQQLDTSAPLRKKFDAYVEPLSQKLGVNPFGMLKRLEVVGITESQLVRQIEFKIRLLFYRLDGTAVDPTAVRLLLPEIANDRLGQALEKQTILAELERHGYYQRDWTVDQSVRDAVATLNRNYLRHVEGELINGAEIPRPEAKTAAEQLKSGSAIQCVAITGAAGGGKSCSLAQVAAFLFEQNTPFLALRLDIQTDVLTTVALGKELGLPISPVGVLACITNGANCVLIIDQLDALSFASGRNPQLWNVFEELLWEVEKYPNMRVLIACRAFDVENDPRLRRLIENKVRTHRIDLGLLPEDIVKQIVGAAGIKPEALGPQRIEMLRTPLHLSLYLQGDPGAHGPFQSVQDLYRRYWDQKNRLVSDRLGRAARWMEVIEKLTAELSKRQTLSAPEDVLDAYAQDAPAMASEHVLVRENRRYRFFHEGFFDYAFARCFVQGGAKLVDWLTESEQHLFRRAQVRQILAYQRGREMDDYLGDLRSVLTDPRVRFHLKKLILQWLRQLDDPTEAEWKIVSALSTDAKLGKHARLVIHDSVGWFDLLDKLGVWSKWLASAKSDEVNFTIWLLSLNDVMRNRSPRVAELVAPYRRSGGEWPRRFRTLLDQSGCYQSRELFDLLLGLLRDGVLDERFSWSGLHNMPDRRADWAAELIAHHLDRLHVAALKLGKEDPFTPETKLAHLRVEFVSKTARHAPENFVRYLLPRVAYLVVVTAEAAYGKVFDPIWVGKVFGREHDAKDALLGSLVRAMAALAKEKPDTLDTLTDGLDTLPHETIAFLIESAWTANGSHYADRAVQYLLGNTAHFEIGYSIWVSGGVREGVSCELLRAITPHCSKAAYAQLEAAILHRETRWEREHPPAIGSTELHLLSYIFADRLSERARLRLAELQRKFPGVKCEAPREMRMQVVPSPIPIEAVTKMTDEQWLSAMAKYAGHERREAKDFLKGNVHQLSQELELAAKQDKERFANLTLKMGDEIHSGYFSAILSAIVEEETPSEERPQPQQVFPEQRTVTPGPPLNTDHIVAVIKRAHALPDQPCGKAICRAVSRIADRKLPDEILDIVSHYATSNPDPDQELWQIPATGGTLYYGGSAITHGINTVRGGAAGAIEQLLFADLTRFQKLEPAILALTHDRILSVRACAVEALLPILNIDRDRAVALFLDLCREADPILGAHFVDRFLYYATFRHYSSVRPVLQKMLTLQDHEAQASAARQICLASFHDREAQEDVKLIEAAAENARAAAAQVYAANLGQEQISVLCRERLRACFHDDSDKVREAAAGCFRQITDVQLSHETDLIAAFIESPAFRAGANQLLFAVEDSTVQLPDVICRIPERVIELHQAGGGEGSIDGPWETHMMAPLVLRLYEQTKDAQTKTRCLNLIDQMIELDFGSIQTELVKVER